MGAEAESIYPTLIVKGFLSSSTASPQFSHIIPSGADGRCGPRTLSRMQISDVDTRQRNFSGPSGTFSSVIERLICCFTKANQR
jgi:hypothetical protein